VCGIVGLSLARVEARSETLAAMSRSIAHRGPDGDGSYLEGGVGLAMRRLAIVDVQHGQQPMATEDGDVVLVFNGEIYNAPALRNELLREGVSFRTRSDTEVILRLYAQNPDDVEARLRGMWAFAIYDRKRQRLVLSRDRLGIKPLFVSQVGGDLYFASELFAFDALRARGEGPTPVIDAGAVHAMLAWSYVPGHRSIYANIERLPPGVRRTVDLRTREVRDRRHYTLGASVQAASVGSLDEARELVAPLLRSAVREHLESDVPIATLLSGGIDSSLVTAAAVDEGASGLVAFSVGFREARFDESPHAASVARSLGVRHEIEMLDVATLRATVVDALLAYDEPFGDSSSLAVYQLSQRVARTHKVALGGDGGDEVFAGYRKHRIVALRRWLTALGPVARKVLSRLPADVDRGRRWTELLRTGRRVAAGLAPDDAASYVALSQVAALDDVAPLVPRSADASWTNELTAQFRAGGDSLLQRTLAADLANTLPNDMLTKVDRASMASGLEVRVPLLDHRIVEVGLGLPAFATLGREGKAVLRSLCERRVGEAAARRRKQGFSVPVEAWLAGPLSGAADRLFSKQRLARHGLLSTEALADGRWRGWLRSHPLVVWHALAFASWWERAHGDGADSVRSVFAEAAFASTPG
jgi:asparagine synthase (glutamine-hydrolysing)